MGKNIITEQQAKDALQIETFRNLSKNKIMEFVSLIPHMDKEIAMTIINQFPEYADTARKMVEQLNVLCDNAIADNNSSQKNVAVAYKLILEELGYRLKKDDVSFEERVYVTEKMIEVADKLSAKDSENKRFLLSTLKCGVSVIGGALFLGVVMLGVNVKDVKIPRTKG